MKGCFRKINGDGKILQMRLQDPNGDWKISTLDPRLMEKRAPDEFGGTYYRLFEEGLLEDYDGYIIKFASRWRGLISTATSPSIGAPKQSNLEPVLTHLLSRKLMHSQISWSPTQISI